MLPTPKINSVRVWPKVLAEIQNQWRTRPASRLLTRRGASCSFGQGVLHILHPDEAFALANRHGEPNNLSAAAVLEWKGMSCCSGADVENPHWQGIAAHARQPGNSRSPEGAAACFARSTTRLFSPGQSRSSVACNALQPQPRAPTIRGRPRDGHTPLAHEEAVHLTGLPVRHSQQKDEPCETTRQDLLNASLQQFTFISRWTGVKEPTSQTAFLVSSAYRWMQRGHTRSFMVPAPSASASALGHRRKTSPQYSTRTAHLIVILTLAFVSPEACIDGHLVSFSATPTYGSLNRFGRHRLRSAKACNLLNLCTAEIS